MRGGEEAIRLRCILATHRAAGTTDKTLRIYDGLHHEVYNEPEHPDVLGDVEAWLQARLQRGSQPHPRTGRS